MTTELARLGITDKSTWNKWMLLNHPDKGGDNILFVKTMKLYKSVDWDAIPKQTAKAKPKPKVKAKAKHNQDDSDSETYTAEEEADFNAYIKELIETSKSSSPYIEKEKFVKPPEPKKTNQCHHIGCRLQQITHGRCKKHQRFM